MPVLRVPNIFNRRLLDEHIAQLDAAVKWTYVLNKDVDTIGRLVAGGAGACEGKGEVPYPIILGVVEQLRKNMHSLVNQLEDLEEHVFL